MDQEGHAGGHRAVGWAVQVVLDDPRLASPMWEQVREWREHKRAVFRSAAMAVYAESMGPEQVQEALDHVLDTTRLWARDTLSRYLVATVICRAVEVGGAEAAFGVLSAWLDDIEHFESVGQHTAMIPLVDRPAMRVTERVAYGPHNRAGFTLRFLGDADDGARAMMIEAVNKNREIRQVHERLWRLALSWPGTSRPAMKQLEQWLRAADEKADMACVCRQLLPELAADEALRRRLVFHARRWLREWGGARMTSEQILREGLAMSRGAAS